MDLLVNLFSDDNLCERMGKIKAPLVRRDFILSQDISNYEKYEGTDPFISWHVKEVLSKARSNKTYDNKILPIKIDTHIELEKAGLGKDDKPYRTIISLEDSLDLVLGLMVTGDWRNIHKMEDYRRYSRGILNLDFDGIHDFEFGAVLGLDEQLDAYINKLVTYEEGMKRILFCFYRDTLVKAQDIAFYIAVYLKYLYQEQGVKLVIKSMSGSSVVIASPIPIDLKLELNGEYGLFVKSFQVNQYLYSSNTEYRGGEL